MYGERCIGLPDAAPWLTVDRVCPTFTTHDVTATRRSTSRAAARLIQG